MGIEGRLGGTKHRRFEQRIGKRCLFVNATSGGWLHGVTADHTHVHLHRPTGEIEIAENPVHWSSCPGHPGGWDPGWLPAEQSAFPTVEDEERWEWAQRASAERLAELAAEEELIRVQWGTRRAMEEAWAAALLFGDGLVQMWWGQASDYRVP